MRYGQWVIVEQRHTDPMSVTINMGWFKEDSTMHLAIYRELYINPAGDNCYGDTLLIDKEKGDIVLREIKGAHRL